MRAFRGLPEDAGSALIVAHSPGCDEAAVLLLGAKAAAAFRFPTGAVLCADAEIERWSRLRSGHATLRW